MNVRVFLNLQMHTLDKKKIEKLKKVVKKAKECAEATHKYKLELDEYYEKYEEKLSQVYILISIYLR